MSYDAILVLCKKCRGIRFAGIDNKKTWAENEEAIQALKDEGHSFQKVRPRAVYNHSKCSCGQRRSRVSDTFPKLF